MKRCKLSRLATLWLVMGVGPFTMRASMITGMVKGSSVGPLFGIDDHNFATTFDVEFTTDDSWTLTGLTGAGFDASKYVLAGTGKASDIPNIAPSDFNITVYHPWVVDNNATQNNLPIPNGKNANRGVTGQDAGGADILITYTPTQASDPTTVNFIQAYIQNPNGEGLGPGTLDNFQSTTVPFYNQGGHAAGTGAIFGVSPLVIAAGGSAWLADIPYACEDGTALQRHDGANCSGGSDETIISQVREFQTFIEASKNINGTDYNVLYGGVFWGYSYQAVDEPPHLAEPSSVLLLATGLAAGFWGYRRRNRFPVSSTGRTR